MDQLPSLATSHPPVALHPAGLAGAQSRYLFALTCMQLGKLTDAETALMPDNDAARVGALGAGAGQRSASCAAAQAQGPSRAATHALG